MGKRDDDDIPDLSQLADGVAQFSSADNAADGADDEDKPTAHFAAVNVDAAAEGATDQYHPSVSKLVGRLEEVDVAPPVKEEVRRLLDAIGDLQKARAELDLYKEIGNPKRKASMEQAMTACQHAQTTLKSVAVQPDDVDVAREREALVGEYRSTRVLLQSLPPEPEPKPEPKPKPREAEAKAETAVDESKPTRDAAVAVKPSAAAAARGARRGGRTWLLLLFGLVVAARAVLWLVAEPPSSSSTPPPPENSAGQGWVAVSAPGSGLDPIERERGAPSVEWLWLGRDADGSLRARVTTTDPNNDPVRVQFVWLVNDTVLLTSDKPVLAASRVKAGRSYRVEAKPFDGKQLGKPLRTGPLRIAAGKKTP